MKRILVIIFLTLGFLISLSYSQESDFITNDSEIHLTEPERSNDSKNNNHSVGNDTISPWIGNSLIIIIGLAIAMGGIALPAYLMFFSSQTKENKDTLEKMNKKLKTLDANLKRLIEESTNFSKFFLVFYNNFMPEDKRINENFAKYIFDLASFNKKERDHSIDYLMYNGDATSIPYLQWVIDNRPDSKEDAEKAIKEIRVRHP